MFQVYATPPIVKTVAAREDVESTEVGRAPFQTRPMFWRMNDMPIAVISGASRGALRRRRYATSSIVVLRTAQNAITITSIRRIIDHRKSPESPASPKLETIVATSIPPSMNTSPWAKLISSRMP